MLCTVLGDFGLDSPTYNGSEQHKVVHVVQTKRTR